MSDKLDDFVAAMQSQVNAETKAAYGEVAFQRWRRPRYMGVMDNPDARGRVTGSCGDTMEIFLRFEDDRVREASFMTDGCGSSGVCASFAAELAHGKNPDELADVTGEKILATLEVFPPEDHHCAFLAAETLQEALNDYMTRQTLKSRSETHELS